MSEKRLLTKKDILNKKFKKDIKGYDAQEVDYFLDQVIRDYISFQKEVEFIIDASAIVKSAPAKFEIYFS